MTQEFPDTMKSRDFRIIGDAATKYQPIDAIAQFKYKGYLISISTAGRSAGACSTEIGVFEGDIAKQIAWCSTVQDALEWVDKRIADIERTNYTKEQPLGDNRQQQLLKLAEVHSTDHGVSYVKSEIERVRLDLKVKLVLQQTLMNNISHATNFDEGYLFSGFTSGSFEAFRSIEYQTRVLSELFIQLEILLSNIVEIPDA